MSKFKSIFSNHKKAIVIGLCVVVAVSLLALLVSCSASGNPSNTSSQGKIGGGSEMMLETDEQATPDEALDPDSPIESLSEVDGVSTAASEATAPDDSGAQPSSTSSQRQRPSAGSGGNGQSATERPTPSASQKKWVEDTQQVWVEDKAAWTEQVPTYGTKEVSICNVCGQDITGNTSAHAKAHMMAGEGSGHHNEVQRVVTGYNTVNHPAEGHYETRVVGGHWE